MKHTQVISLLFLSFLTFDSVRADVGDSGFENQRTARISAPWQVAGVAWIRNSSNFAYKGSRYAAIRTSDRSRSGWIYQWVDVKPRTNYMITVVARSRYSGAYMTLLSEDNEHITSTHFSRSSNWQSHMTIFNSSRNQKILLRVGISRRPRSTERPLGSVRLPNGRDEFIIDEVHIGEAPPIPMGESTYNFPMTELERQLFMLINAEREEAEVPLLQISRKLQQAAVSHAMNMARKKTQAHVLDGKDAKFRLERTGYEYGWRGENIFSYYTSLEEIVQGWMDSEDHEKNILNPNFTQSGIGIRYDSDGMPYYCQVFASPR